MLIEELLNKFKLSIELPQDILQMEVEGVYQDMYQKKIKLQYITPNAMRDYDYFDCYIFESDEFKVVLCPSNFYCMLSIYKKRDGMLFGRQYNFKGDLISVN